MNWLALQKWLHMGGYGFFVWACVGLTFVILFYVYVRGYFRLQQSKKKILSCYPQKKTPRTRVQTSELGQ